MYVCIGAEALDRVKEAYVTGDRYDVVLCDIQVRRRKGRGEKQVYKIECI